MPPGKFAVGDRVRLRRPGEHEGINNPRAVLEVVAAHWFRPHEPPTYVLQEPGGIGVTPFRDEDLMRARKVAPNAVLTRGEAVAVEGTVMLEKKR
jgi:hypothetical protein